MTLPSPDSSSPSADTGSLTSRQSYGFFCCVLACCFYSVVYGLLRLLTVYHIGSAWSILILNSVMLLTTLPVVVPGLIRGKYKWPGPKIIACFAGACVTSNILGVWPLLWAYDEIGLAVASPLLQASQIIGATLLGMLLFREKLTLLKSEIIVVLIAAVCFLSLAKGTATDSEAASGPHAVSSETGPEGMTIEAVSPGRAPAAAVPVPAHRWAKGIFFTLVSGFGMALYVILIHAVLRRKPRRLPSGETVLSDPLPPPMVIFMMGISTVLLFSFILLIGNGPSAFYMGIPGPCWGIGVLIGLATTIGFFFKSESLRHITASKLSLICVLQVLLLTLIGLFLFREPVNGYIWPGILLTAIGVAATGKVQ